MLKFYLKVAIYLVSFGFSLFALTALDFNRFLKKGAVAPGALLYILLAMIMADLIGDLILEITYFFQVF